MRIVHISPFYYPSIGGIETFCRELSIRTAHLGHEVHVITFTQWNSPGDNDEGVLVHRVKPLLKWYKARFSPHVRSLVKRIRPDVVHIQAPAPLTQEHAMMDGCKYLATYHNDPVLADTLSYRLSTWLYRKLIFPVFCSKVDRVICPSKSFQQTSEFLRLINEQKRGVIPNGVDTSLFRPHSKPKINYRQELGLDSEHVGIFVGSMERWHAYKGVTVLLEALFKLSDVDLQFIFVGDGELRPVYEKVAKSLINAKKVKFLGTIAGSKLVQSYWAADFFVLPSTSKECCPLVLIEAMACGLPIIATNLSGSLDLLAHGFNGFKVRARDSQHLADTIRKLVLLDTGELERMSLNCRKLVDEKYNWDTVVEAYLLEYSSLLAHSSDRW